MREDIHNALATIKQGGIILYPTDTVWGLGCDATNAEAVQKIYDIKLREESKSMIMLLDNDNKIPLYVKEVPNMAWDLLDLSDKPLTIIYPGAKNLAKNLINEDGSVGIRVTHDTFCNKLIYQLRKPLVSTSANISGKPAPAIYSEIDDYIISQADYVVKWRQEQKKKRPPSGIIKIGMSGEISVLRK